MKTWTLRLGLSLMIVIGFWTNGLPAQELLVVPEVPYEPAQHPRYPLPLVPRPQPPASPYLLHRSLYAHGIGCQGDGYYNTCGGWHYEARFIFGSCQSFFNQPCYPGLPCYDKHRQR